MVTISDLQMAQLCAATYDTAFAWDHKWDLGGVHFDGAMLPEGVVIAYRGSRDDHDWTEDFKAWPRLDPEIGYVHAGFLEGVDRSVSAIIQYLGPRREFFLTGHSLGAAHALLAGAILTLAGLKPQQISVFGCPRIGFGKVCGVLNDGGYPITIYRNGRDPVPKVPLAIPFLWPYQKPVADTMLDEPPAEPEDIFEWHQIHLYVQGVSKKNEK